MTYSQAACYPSYQPPISHELVISHTQIASFTHYLLHQTVFYTSSQTLTALRAQFLYLQAISFTNILLC